MNEHQPFLDAITANPDDQTTRLVYADWLDERGETGRADFLRVLSEWHGLAASDPNRNPVCYVEQRERLRLLRASLDQTWLVSVQDQGLVGDVVHAKWGYDSSRNTFCVIVRETAKTVVLIELPKKMTLNHDGTGQSGREIPMLPQWEEVLRLDPKKGLRAQKSISASGGKLCFYRRQYLFYFWDGKDAWFD